MSITTDVKRLLESYPVCRDSDKALLVYYWQMKGLNLTREQMLKFKELPAPETIRRIRQKEQEIGNTPATKEVDDARFKKYTEMKHGIEYNDPEQLLEKQGIKLVPWGQNGEY